MFKRVSVCARVRACCACVVRGCVCIHCKHVHTETQCRVPSPGLSVSAAVTGSVTPPKLQNTVPQQTGQPEVIPLLNRKSRVGNPEAGWRLQLSQGAQGRPLCVLCRAAAWSEVVTSPHCQPEEGGGGAEAVGTSSSPLSCGTFPEAHPRRTVTRGCQAEMSRASRPMGTSGKRKMC